MLHDVVEGLCIRTGLPKPKVYIVDDPAPNAFAFGRSPSRAGVCVTSGLLSAGGTYYVVNHLLGGLAFPIGFFPVFLIPREALLWGLAIGAITSLTGSIMPGLSAGGVKVADVFSKVT